MQKLESAILIEFHVCTKEEMELHKDKYVNNGYLSHDFAKPEIVNRDDYEYRHAVNSIAKDKRLLIVKRLKKPEPKKDKVKYEAKDLINDILLYYDVSKRSIFKQCRKEEVRSIRQIIQTMVYFCTKRNVIIKNLSLVQIGEMTGYRDHATILNSVKRVRALYETETDYRENLDKLMKHLKIEEDLECMFTMK